MSVRQPSSKPIVAGPYEKGPRRWQVYVRYRGDVVWTPSFSSAEDARHAADRLRGDLRGELAAALVLRLGPRLEALVRLRNRIRLRPTGQYSGPTSERPGAAPLRRCTFPYCNGLERAERHEAHAMEHMRSGRPDLVAAWIVTAMFTAPTNEDKEAA